MLDWPVEGAVFDVQHNDLWHPSWGQRPADMSSALSAARRHLARAPKMIPDLTTPPDWTPPPMVPFWSDFL